MALFRRLKRCICNLLGHKYSVQRNAIVCERCEAVSPMPEFPLPLLIQPTFIHSILGKKPGITKLSELIIDVAKDWGGYRIANIGVPTTLGDVLRKGTRLTMSEIPDGTLNYLLLGQGAGVNPAYGALGAVHSGNQHADGGTLEITNKLDYYTMNIIQARATATTTFSTTSTSYVDVTGLSLSVLLGYTSYVLVTCSCYCIANPGGGYALYQQLVRGTTAIKRTTQGAAASFSANSLIQKLDNVAAGTYTYKLQGCVNGGTGYWYMNAAPAQGDIFVIAFAA